MGKAEDVESRTGVERAARVDLAAAFRLAVRLDMHEGVCNHFSLMLPGTRDRFLLNRFGLHWSEVSASNLLALDASGKILEGKGEFEKTAFYIHSRIHLANPNAACVLHTHMPYASALTLTRQRALDPCLSQGAMRFHGRIAVDEQYNGLALDHGEGERIARAMGGADVAFLGNHGVVVCGDRMDHTYDDLYYLERACRLEVLARQSGLPLAPVNDRLSAHVGAQIAGERLQSELFFAALGRMLPER